MNNTLTTFLGSGPSAEGAIDEAIGQANEWLSRHQWRTSDGQSCYSLTSALGYGTQYWYVLTFYGPDKETELEPRAYTGATERLG